MNQKPAKFDQLLQILTSGDNRRFLSEFNALSTEKEKIECLTYNQYQLLGQIKEQLEQQAFEQIMKPIKVELDNYRLNGLFTAAQAANYDEFCIHFRAIPIHERLFLLCSQEKSLLEYPLFKIIYPRFHQQQLMNILEMLPAYRDLDDVIANLESTPYQPPMPVLTNPQTELDSDYYIQLIKILIQALNSKNEPNKEKVRSVMRPIWLQIPIEASLKKINIAHALEMNKEDFIAFLKRLPYNSFPELFLKEEGDAHIFYLLLRRQGPEALVKLFKRFTDDDYLKIQTELQKNYSDTPLFRQLLAFPGVHTSEVLNALKADLDQDDIRWIISQLMKNNTADAANSILTLLRICGRFNLLLTSTESGVLYERLLIMSGENASNIIDEIVSQLDDNRRAKLIFEFYDNLPLNAVVSILSKMSSVARHKALTTRMTDQAQTFLIEKIVIDVKTNLNPFIDIIALINDSRACFNIYTTPVKYGVRKIYAQNNIANSAAGAISSVASYIPIWGKQAVESLQREEDVTEFLICHMIRANASLITIIPALLNELQAEQITALLREPDSTGKTLLMYCLSSNEKEMIDILVKAKYETADKDKLLDPKSLDFFSMRADLKHRQDASALIGFIALLTLYNYLAVRGMEPNPEPYNQSRDDFLNMLRVLQSNLKNPNICLELKRHCDNNPLREAWGIPTAMGTLKLGTNRHLDARNKLLDLTITELKDGLTLFGNFIERRIHADINRDVNSLDQHMIRIFKSNHHSSKSVTFDLI